MFFFGYFLSVALLGPQDLLAPRDLQEHLVLKSPRKSFFRNLRRY